MDFEGNLPGRGVGHSVRGEESAGNCWRARLRDPWCAGRNGLGLVQSLCAYY